MRIASVWFATLLFLFAGALGAATGDFADIPQLKARVTDTSGTLSPGDIAGIEAQLKAFEQKKGSQMVVLVVPTTQPEAIEQYSLRVAEAWKIGRKGVNDGVILLVAKNDRKMRIEVGYGLEGAIPDAVAKRVIAEVISPKFRSGDFAGGIRAGVEKLTSVASGEALPPPEKKRVSSSRGGSSFDILPFAIFAVVVAGVVLRSLAGRFMGASLTGGVSGVAAFFILGSLGIAVVAGIIVFIIVLLMSFGNWGGGGWGGGGGFSSGGGGGGGDSFSGGGGDFGGGGASGDW
jgi:uncharacterized protein